MKDKILAVLGVAAFVTWTGCQHPSSNRFDPYGETTPAGEGQFESVAMTNRFSPEMLKPALEPYQLGPGDKLEIELMEDVNTRTMTTVGPDGKIYFSLLPGLDVWGLTLTQARQLLEREMGKFIPNTPQIGITLRGIESQKIWLLGRLQNPGAYPVGGPVSVLEAVSVAGGPLSITGAGMSREVSAGDDDLADLRRAFLVRNGEVVPVDFHALLKEGDMRQNVFLKPDDFIYFPSAAAKDVYVMGAVIQPRTIPYAEDLTVMSSITYAYGPANNAHLGQVAIVRGSLSNPKIAIINYRDIREGRANDVRLQPRDIVYVPFSPYRFITKYADLILNTFVNSVAINEGARAVLDSPPPQAGILIPLGSRIQILPPPPPSPR